MLSESFNFVEGIWWIGFGVWAVRYYRASRSSEKSPACYERSGCRIKSGMTKKHLLLLAIILILFGISDFVEMATGAWWRPWWLLIWKGLCLIVGIILVILILKERRN